MTAVASPRGSWAAVREGRVERGIFYRKTYDDTSSVQSVDVGSRFYQTNIRQHVTFFVAVNEFRYGRHAGASFRMAHVGFDGADFQRLLASAAEYAVDGVHLYRISFLAGRGDKAKKKEENEAAVVLVYDRIIRTGGTRGRTRVRVRVRVYVYVETRLRLTH